MLIIKDDFFFFLLLLLRYHDHQTHSLHLHIKKTLLITEVRKATIK